MVEGRTSPRKVGEQKRTSRGCRLQRRETQALHSAEENKATGRLVDAGKFYPTVQGSCIANKIGVLFSKIQKASIVRVVVPVWISQNAHGHSCNYGCLGELENTFSLGDGRRADKFVTSFWCST